MKEDSQSLEGLFLGRVNTLLSNSTKLNKQHLTLALEAAQDLHLIKELILQALVNTNKKESSVKMVHQNPWV
jgi:hypothetical protein